VPDDDAQHPDAERREPVAEGPVADARYGEGDGGDVHARVRRGRVARDEHGQRAAEAVPRDGDAQLLAAATEVARQQR